MSQSEIDDSAYGSLAFEAQRLELSNTKAQLQLQNARVDRLVKQRSNLQEEVRELKEQIERLRVGNDLQIGLRGIRRVEAYLAIDSEAMSNPELKPALEAIIQSLPEMRDGDFERLGLAIAKEVDRRVAEMVREMSRPKTAPRN